MRASAVILAVVLVGLLPFEARSGSPPGPRGSHWQRNRLDPRWVQGQIDLATPATAVWERITDVPRWPWLFSDMTSFSVESRSPDGTHWVVRFESRTFGHGRYDYFLALNPNSHSASMVLDAIGVRGTAYASVVATGDGRSRATYSLLVESHGIAGWFVSDSALRVRQESLVRRTLGDLETAFGRVTD